MDLKKLLNREQYEAASTIEGPLLILAGAGSGKTRVLTYRIAHMIEDLGIYPSSILAITFTNKAAGEMKERIKALVGDVVDSMWVSTFHSSCVRILRREIDKIGYNKNFAIYDTSDQKVLMKECMKELNINDKDITDREILGKISDQKNNLISAEQFKMENERNYKLNKIADVYLLYQKKLKSNNALDFDDLIFKTVELLKKHKDVLEFYQRKFKYIMVDEYQDTNRAQYELVKLLAAGHRNICVVGDDDQCLPKGSMVSTPRGKVAIENLKEGSEVLCAAGNGQIHKGQIEKIMKKEYNDILVKVTTKSGREIKATPNHITFFKLDPEEGIYYVYLMYKKAYGYRIGITKASRSRKEGYKSTGLALRLNGEQGDKMWIIKVCKDKKEASYYEQYYSTKYSIPTVVFNVRGRRISMTQEQIDRIYKEINTYEGAANLMRDSFLYEEYPHHFASAVIRGNTVRKIVNLNYFSGKKSEEKGYHSHRIALITSGDEEREKAVKAGFNARKGSRNTWRIETERRIYDEAEKYAKSIACIDEHMEIVRKARLTEEGSYLFVPFGSLKEGMKIVIRKEDKLIEDTVEKVEFEEFKGYVYDLSIPEFRQYICNDIVVHNCIYQWRGADIRNILDFEKDYAEAKVVKLEQNYRSKANILNAANEVIRNNAQRKNKVLRTEMEDGDKINIYRAYSDIDEGMFVCKTIKNLMKEKNKNFKDFAILYRTNAQSRIFEDVFIKNAIPYRIIGGLKFYDRKEIKDILAYLKLINNPVDDISLKRIINVPKRAIGDTTVEKIQHFANTIEDCLYSVILDVENVPGLSARNITSINKFTSLINSFIANKDEMMVSELIEEIIDKTGYLDSLLKTNTIEDKARIENLKELVSAAVEFENSSEDKSLFAFLEQVTLVSDIDNFNEEADSVVLMTVHSAKGLEFPVVFMVGMENGMFPGMASLNDFNEMEESRRLCYVGITRAKEQLYMTSAESRRVFGRTVCYEESDFIAEIPLRLRERVNLQNSNPRVMARRSVDDCIRNNPHSLRNSFNPFSNNSFKEESNGYNNSNAGKEASESEIVEGRKVRHSTFGVGTVVSKKVTDSGIKITVVFDNYGIKNLMYNKSILEVL
ncbi:UvrD-helicase domain-containing protein [Haloimpatiens lingqiaonensis]|uniref:UvrD-helicase domain-containing protein n=1 Tax=Haloimpatiens lingqiaonensis TaxID=1380675 RepID=UPI0037C02BF7